ncbi:hypothetical protein EDB19DRAFT_2027380 [Suillus lakei]|nr:hypothetical protein EDB19DRAFT_2027380 [Suillus lakei]
MALAWPPLASKLSHCGNEILASKQKITAIRLQIDPGKYPLDRWIRIGYVTSAELIAGLIIIHYALTTTVSATSTYTAGAKLSGCCSKARSCSTEKSEISRYEITDSLGLPHISLFSLGWRGNEGGGFGGAGANGGRMNWYGAVGSAEVS